MKTSLLTFCFLCIAVFVSANTFNFNENEKMPTAPSSTINSVQSTEVGTANYFSCSVLHVIVVNGKKEGEYFSSAPDDDPNCGGIVYHVFKKAPGA